MHLRTSNGYKTYMFNAYSYHMKMHYVQYNYYHRQFPNGSINLTGFAPVRGL